MMGPALLDEDRGDAFGRGASGYGVRMLVELVTTIAEGRPQSGEARGHPQRAFRLATGGFES
jgi:hypothetical protein